jgi:cation:H+ antiporter
MIDLVIHIVILVIGLFVMIYAADKSVDHSILFASALGVSPLLIGLIFVSIGTDLPEIVNSIVASGLGHLDIDVGDSIGSVMTQLTLVFGLLSFVVKKPFRIDKRIFFVMGSCLLLSLLLVYSTVESGFITRINALFMIGSLPIYLILINSIVGIKQEVDQSPKIKVNKMRHLVLALISFIGVAVGSYFVVTSVIEISTVFNIPEYIISFFAVAIGTSLPELVVDVKAIRKGETALAYGDIMGSCIVDATLSIGIGAFIFPQRVSAILANIGILYKIIASFIVLLLITLRGTIDRKAGIILICLYLLSYILLFL